jgi:hypothetical protein
MALPTSLQFRKQLLRLDLAGDVVERAFRRGWWGRGGLSVWLLPVGGASDALQGGGDGSGGTDLAADVDGADVDAEFEGSGGDDAAEVAGAQAGLGFVAPSATPDYFFTFL